MSVVPGMDSRRSQDLRKGPTYLRPADRRVIPICQKVRGDARRYLASSTVRGVGPQHIGKPWSDRDQPVFLELGVPHRRHGLGEVEIRHGQAARLPAAQSGSVQKQDQCAERLGVELARVAPASVDDAEDPLQLVMGRGLSSI